MKKYTVRFAIRSKLTGKYYATSKYDLTSTIWTPQRERALKWERAEACINWMNMLGLNEKHEKAPFEIVRV